ncbi:MAG TPA: sugar phosphate isomerase/epimerase [Candidatus Latescibacteria bacterium]|nr:sugar phosphate isomerase/epimerase [Candidatus Latescibacterota bacterium]
MIKIGCNYLSFKGAEIGVEDFIQTCHDLRLDCLDFHQRAFASQDTDYLLGIKRQCLDLGLPVGYLGVAGGFAGDDDFQQAKIEEAKSAVDMALVLGAPLIRVFGWKTFKTEGRDPMFAALARCLREVCDYGAQKGVVVALQNHDNRNLASTGPDVLRIFQDVDHANLSFIMDTGQWRGSPGASGDPDPEVDIYGYMEQTLPHAGYVRCKIYQIAGGREEVLDYGRIARLLRGANYNGCISIVYEGREQADRAELIGKAAAHLREVFGLDTRGEE